jgi:hypothetical protein
MVRGGGADTPSEPESSRRDDKEEDKDEEEREVAPPSHSPPRETLPLLGDILSRHARIAVNVRRPKHP